MLEAAAQRNLKGQTYRLVCPLASGGMGRVDLVARRDGAFFRLYAQKRPRAELVDDPDVRRMFLDEARIAGLVRHPNVVSVVDLGEDRRGPFLVMEFIEGVPLSQLVRAVIERGEQVPLEVCLSIATDVARGLHALHELRGSTGEALELIHRDVSPQNVLVGFDGTARITDFGIAKCFGRLSRTSTGILKGKVGYLSPEQLRFESLDRRADLFAFGIVLFELLAAKRLYEGGGENEVPQRILHEPPPDLADFREDAGAELVELLFELLAKDRERRPATAGAVADRLAAMSTALLLDGNRVQPGVYVQRLLAKEHQDLRGKIADAGNDQHRSQPPGEAPPGPSRRRAITLVMAGTLVVAAGTAALLAGGTRLPDHATTSQPTAIPPTHSAPAPSHDVTGSVGSTSPPTRDETEPGAANQNRASDTRARASVARKPPRRIQRDTASPSAASCNPPYEIDATGGRRFKSHCLTDSRR